MKQSLIQKLNVYRMENNLTQEELASKLGVTFQTVNRWLNGRVKPSEMKEYQIRKLIGLTAQSK